jgi:NADP-dependent 3-hydroxy acid dehydrogenase YdfG
MAVKFAELGHVVVGCGRSKQAIASLQKELGAPHRFSVVDVTQDEQVSNWASEVIKTVGTPHLLLNNAAQINPRYPPCGRSPGKTSTR